MILQKQEIISKPNFNPADILMTFGLEVVYCSIYLGEKYKFDSKENLKIKLKEMYSANKIVTDNIDNLSILSHS